MFILGNNVLVETYNDDASLNEPIIVQDLFVFRKPTQNR